MKRGLDAYKLKLIALIFMILDHILLLNYPAHEHLNLPLLPEWIGVIARFVSPLFLYLMIDGFYHTRSRAKFLIRLFVAAIIMWCGNAVVNFYFPDREFVTGEQNILSLIQGHNIFITLAILFALVWCLESWKSKKNRLLNCILIPIIAVLSLLFEGGFFLLPIAVVMWFFHEKKGLQCVGIIAWCLVLLIKALISQFSGNTGTSLYNYLCFSNEWANFLVIPFMFLYNGERGKNTKFTKYLFYFIYPVHLWLIMILRVIIKMQ